GSHLHPKVFHDHAALLGGGQAPRDTFTYVAKEQPKSDSVSDFYQLTDLRILGLLQLTIMVALPDETPNRRVRTTDPIKQVKYGMADSLGPNERVSAWDLASSRFRMADDECLFGMFHARESDTSSSAISKYLCDHFLYAFREELDKVTEQAQDEAPKADGKKTVNFTEPPSESDHRSTQLSNDQ
ncbi:cysteinyl-tRNA synthetase, partial [Linderina pennispora]